MSVRKFDGGLRQTRVAHPLARQEVGRLARRQVKPKRLPLALRIHAAFEQGWTPEAEAAWTPLAAPSALPPRAFAEAFVSDMFTDLARELGRSHGDMLDDIANGVLLEWIRGELEQGHAAPLHLHARQRHAKRPRPADR
jgi:hypothetical protein